VIPAVTAPAHVTVRKSVLLWDH